MSLSQRKTFRLTDMTYKKSEHKLIYFTLLNDLLLLILNLSFLTIQKILFGVNRLKKFISGYYRQDKGRKMNVYFTYKSNEDLQIGTFIDDDTILDGVVHMRLAQRQSTEIMVTQVYALLDESYTSECWMILPTTQCFVSKNNSKFLSKLNNKKFLSNCILAQLFFFHSPVIFVPFSRSRGSKAQSNVRQPKWHPNYFIKLQMSDVISKRPDLFIIIKIPQIYQTNKISSLEMYFMFHTGVNIKIFTVNFNRFRYPFVVEFIVTAFNLLIAIFKTLFLGSLYCLHAWTIQELNDKVKQLKSNKKWCYLNTTASWERFILPSSVVAVINCFQIKFDSEALVVHYEGVRLVVKTSTEVCGG
ncbi:hypothetical protein EGR_00611 [Echinococcus granulosus]|uniref:Uncharacterized protein n=1 Tax=Echinococcus granulosus TaxID=6210 RepID=W6UVJ3_ECHGR|nr:hypothetical protein EGR_00611 [Echinococcus granulosus]EUB64661.1 hypothetical protein EGR_00611 [Echinococcus granulosus]